MDGFGYDLLKPEYVPNIYKWATQGTWFTSGMRVQYVSFTTTNHMGMVTEQIHRDTPLVFNGPCVMQTFLML
ncbi:hypothetical protein TELCIR_22610 [Teladorsagia circumcincta]|uniref:Uncharacterized protein n=1 Tax=Teladorsagia circumcincta TaxID=45464 RepID=A0A2G9TDP6_TELCI|nr:hypothetical protein TELCIR_22610 [Teladorsagia circumcincta]